MMIALRVLRASKHLKIAVDVGLVVGITAAITPIGSAIFLVPNALSSSILPQVLVLQMLIILIRILWVEQNISDRCWINIMAM